MRQAFAGKRGIRVRILNDVPYFLHVEYGTSIMDARAMVRRSIEPIMALLDELWGWLPGPFFTPDDLEVLFGQVKDGAIEIIVDRTPWVTGTLAKGFEGEVEHF
ncbi:MAG: hypothetical protein CVV27_04695 [Candidatus Melainabacteria bacterium HGW-Melainabacteria-1]|nr:MAG: hypothetical protein CVV27_04695 [Candidatus Melainabacteria bacterium HGW-Melainabacteria-1]